MTKQTNVALRFAEIAEDLPLLLLAGNAEMELRKAALRAGSQKKLRLGYREFQKGTAHPELLPCSVIESPPGPFNAFDAGRHWDRLMRPENYDHCVLQFVEVCRRADAVVLDRVDDLETTRSILRMGAAYGVARTAVWIDRLPSAPPPDERAREAKRLAKESFSKVKVFQGDMKAIAACQCGDDECETCGPWLELLEYATQSRKPAREGAFRMLVTDVTGWGIRPHTRIARGVQCGTVEPGDTVELHTKSEKLEIEVEDVARGGIVFSVRGVSNDEIVALAKRGSLELRKSAAVREYGEPRAGSGHAYVEGAPAGRVSVRSDASKSLLRFKEAAGFRSGDVVSVFFEQDRRDVIQADSYVIRTL
jgi:hypothetical protein